MNPLEKVAIGNQGVEVTRLGLGGAPLSGMVLGDGLYGGTASDEAGRIVRRALELGINYFDTAPLYGAGLSEVRYGAALKGVDRDSYVISTKVGRVLELVEGGMTAEESPDNFAEHYSVDTWTRDNVLRSIEESLERLQTDHVEIVLIHDPDRAAHGEREAIDEGFPTLIELREQGVVKAIGCGMNEWEMPSWVYPAVRHRRGLVGGTIYIAGPRCVSRVPAVVPRAGCEDHHRWSVQQRDTCAGSGWNGYFRL